jgi:hypothetical protein
MPALGETLRAVMALVYPPMLRLRRPAARPSQKQK